MSFPDVVFLPSRASFPSIFLENCGRSECLWNTTCPKTVIGGMLPHTPSLLLQKVFLASDQYYCHNFFNFFNFKNFISAVCMSYRINSIHTCGIQEINFTVKQLRRIYKKLK